MQFAFLKAVLAPQGLVCFVAPCDSAFVCVLQAEARRKKGVTPTLGPMHGESTKIEEEEAPKKSEEKKEEAPAKP